MYSWSKKTKTKQINKCRFPTGNGVNTFNYLLNNIRHEQINGKLIRDVVCTQHPPTQGAVCKTHLKSKGLAPLCERGTVQGQCHSNALVEARGSDGVAYEGYSIVETRV